MTLCVLNINTCYDKVSFPLSLTSDKMFTYILTCSSLYKQPVLTPVRGLNKTRTIKEYSYV